MAKFKPPIDDFLIDDVFENFFSPIMWDWFLKFAKERYDNNYRWDLLDRDKMDAKDLILNISHQSLYYHFLNRFSNCYPRETNYRRFMEEFINCYIINLDDLINKTQMINATLYKAKGKYGNIIDSTGEVQEQVTSVNDNRDYLDILNDLSDFDGRNVANQQGVWSSKADIFKNLNRAMNKNYAKDIIDSFLSNFANLFLYIKPDFNQYECYLEDENLIEKMIKKINENCLLINEVEIKLNSLIDIVNKCCQDAVSKKDFDEFKQQYDQYKKIIDSEITSIKVDIKRLSDLITNDEGLIEKLQKLIKDLENIDISFLVRLTKIENIYLGFDAYLKDLYTLQFSTDYFKIDKAGNKPKLIATVNIKDVYFGDDSYLLKDYRSVTHSERDFSYVRVGDKPNLQVQYYINDTIARKTDLPDISKLATKDELNKKADKNTIPDTSGQYSEFIIDKGGILFNNLCRIDNETKKIKLANGDIIDIPLLNDTMKYIPYVYVGQDSELIVDWNLEKQIEKVKAKGISRDDQDQTKIYTVDNEETLKRINKFKLQEYITSKIEDINWQSGSNSVSFTYIAEPAFLKILISFLYT